MLGDLSVCKHLPGNPGLTAHGEPVLENNIVLFLSCSFEEPAITASFLHLSLRSVLVVARNSNRELRESTASAITSHTGSRSSAHEQLLVTCRVCSAAAKKKYPS